MTRKEIDKIKLISKLGGILPDKYYLTNMCYLCKYINKINGACRNYHKEIIDVKHEYSSTCRFCLSHEL